MDVLLLFFFSFHVCFRLFILSGMIYRKNKICISNFFFYVWNSDISEIIRTRSENTRTRPEMRKYPNGFYIPLLKYPNIRNTRSEPERVPKRPPLLLGKAMRLVSFIAQLNPSALAWNNVVVQYKITVLHQPRTHLS